MPNSKNQNPNSGNARQQNEDAGRDHQQATETVTDRLREGYDTAREGAMQGYRQAEGLVARNPGSSLLIGFGVGFGLGVVLTTLLSREQSWTERHLSGVFQDVPDRYHRLVDSLKSLPSTVHDHLPSSITKHLG